MSAAPYVPPAYQQPQGNPADYMHPHQQISYGYEAPPPPMGQPPPGWIPATPYFYEQGAPHPQGGAHAPPYVQHMCTIPPPPHVVGSSANKSGGGRATPSTVTSNSNTSLMSSGEVQPQPAAVVTGPPGPPGGPGQPPQEYEVEYHLHQGEVISLQLGDGRVQIIPGKTMALFFIYLF